MTAKADRARELLNDPIFKEVVEKLRDEYRKAFENARCSDEDAIEVRKMLFLTHRMEQHLQQIISDGELADFRANEDERPPFLGDLDKWLNRKR